VWLCLQCSTHHDDRRFHAAPPKVSEKAPNCPKPSKSCRDTEGSYEILSCATRLRRRRDPYLALGRRQSTRIEFWFRLVQPLVCQKSTTLQNNCVVIRDSEKNTNIQACHMLITLSCVVRIHQPSHAVVVCRLGRTR
jgi:hypothetical protein